jgi:hypothetical protein
MGFRLDLGVFPVRHSSWKREHLRFLPFDEVVCACVLWVCRFVLVRVQLKVQVRVPY